MINILLVVNEPRLIDLLKHKFDSSVECNIDIAYDLDEAISFLNRKKDFHFVLCDHEGENINAEKLFDFMLKSDVYIPFVCMAKGRDGKDNLCSKGTSFGYIDKNNLISDLRKILTKFLKYLEKKLPDFISIKMNSLKDMDFYPVDIYVKLSDKKYVKVFKEDDKISEDDFLRFQKRGVDNLYFSSSQGEDFILAFQIFVSDIVSDLNIEDTFKLKNVFEKLFVCYKIFGASDQFNNIFVDTMNSIIPFLKGKTNLSLLFDDFNTATERFLSNHSVMLAIISSKIAAKLNLTTQDTFLKFAIASFAHDITIEQNQFVHISSLVELDLYAETSDEKDLQNYKMHPQDAGEILSTMNNIPADVDRIIIDHHELPDGSGFPRKINHGKLGFLTLVFITSHLLVDEIYKVKGKFNITNFVNSAFSNYNYGKMAEIISAIKYMNFF